MVSGRHSWCQVRQFVMSPRPLYSSERLSPVLPEEIALFKRYRTTPVASYASCIKVLVDRLSRRMQLLLVSYYHGHYVSPRTLMIQLHDRREALLGKRPAMLRDKQEALDYFSYALAEPPPDLELIMRQKEEESPTDLRKRGMHFLHEQREAAAEKVMSTPPRRVDVDWLEAALEYAESSILLEHGLRGIETGSQVNADLVAPLLAAELRAKLSYYLHRCVVRGLRSLIDDMFCNVVFIQHTDLEVESPVGIDKDGKKQHLKQSPSSVLPLEPPLKLLYSYVVLDKNDSRLHDFERVLDFLRDGDLDGHNHVRLLMGDVFEVSSQILRTSLAGLRLQKQWLLAK